jgi:teichuronic acid biosynthesis glycosyltransferase TuaC
VTLRVLHVTNMYPSSDRPAAGVFIRRQVESLRSEGVEQDILAIPPTGGATRYLRVGRTLRAVLEAFRPSVVHAHHGLAGWVASGVGHHPMVVTFAGSDLYGKNAASMASRLRGRGEVLLSRRGARTADRVIVMNGRMVGLLPAAVWSRAEVLPYGIDTSQFRPGSRSEARRRFDLPTHLFLVLWPHSDTPNKRRDIAEAAVSLARLREPSVRLWRPPPTTHEEMHFCYQAADCLLLLSETEGSPNTVKEAICCGLPVIGVDVGDVAQWVTRAPGSRLVVRSAEAVAQAILELLADRPEPTIPAWVHEFDEGVVAKRLVRMYEALLTGRDAPRVLASLA